MTYEQMIEWLENHSRKLGLTILEMDITNQQWPAGLKDYLHEMCQDVDFLVEDLKRTKK